MTCRDGLHTNDSDVVLGGLELPESDIDGDTTLALGLELVKNPGILEGALAELSGFLLELSASSLRWTLIEAKRSSDWQCMAG